MSLHGATGPRWIQRHLSTSLSANVSKPTDSSLSHTRTSSCKQLLVTKNSYPSIEATIDWLGYRWRFGSVGNVVGRINEVNQRRARLVPGWVNPQMGKPPWYVTSHPGQLSLAIPPWVSAMSTSESWDVNRHTAQCSLSVVWQCKLVSGWGLKIRISAPLYGPYGSGRTLRFFTFDWLAKFTSRK